MVMHDSNPWHIFKIESSPDRERRLWSLFIKCCDTAPKKLQIRFCSLSMLYHGLMGIIPLQRQIQNTETCLRY